MKQPIAKKNKKNVVKKKSEIKVTRPKKHKEYGTSKLERDFARDFLDKLGVEYTYQFEAKDIGRWYDFYLPKESILIEVDGDYWHGKDTLYEDKNNMQKRSAKVDDLKNRWAMAHGIPLIRIWESDIRKKPSEVMKMLKERLYIVPKKENKGKRLK